MYPPLVFYWNTRNMPFGGVSDLSMEMQTLNKMGNSINIDA